MWKLIWKELLVYTLTFLSISLIYRYGLNVEQQKTMEMLIKWCRKQSTGESRLNSQHDCIFALFTTYNLPLRCLSTSQSLYCVSISFSKATYWPGLPLTFLLGFYVSLVVRRWWEQYCKL